MNISNFSSRTRKNSFLQEIIQKLRIHKEEKELYILSLEVLEDKEFDIFFEKIFTQVSVDGRILDRKVIEPLTNTLF